jgi:copper/silver efflux system protein
VSVFGKAGRAATATDPAPLEMFETVINLRSKAEWRLGMTVDKLIAEMDQALQFPDIANAWTMPTRARNRTYYSAQRWRFSCTEMGDSRSSAIARSRHQALTRTGPRLVPPQSAHDRGALHTEVKPAYLDG